LDDSLRIILAGGVLIAIYMITRWVIVWRMNNSAKRIMRDLNEQEAIDRHSAIKLPYAEKSWAKIGLRDYDGKALEGLIAMGVVEQTDDGRYFLKEGRGDQ